MAEKICGYSRSGNNEKHNSKKMKYSLFKFSCFLMLVLIVQFSCQKKVEVVEVPVDNETGKDSIVPVITGFTPDVSWNGNIVTISGSGFSKDASKVWIGDTRAEIIAASETSLKIKVAPLTQNGLVHVTAHGKQAVSSKELIIDQLAWTKEIGGSADEVATCIIPISGGYMVAGYTTSMDGDIKPGHGLNDMWVAQLDSNRNIVWQQTIGGTGNDVFRSIVVTSDGKYLATGYSNSKDGDLTGGLTGFGAYNAWAIKFNKDGTIAWKKPLGGTNNDLAFSSAPTTDGGCVIAGSTTSNDIAGTVYHGGDDILIVKLNADGNIVWQKTLGGSVSERPRAIVSTSDGGCMVLGYTNSSDGDLTTKRTSSDVWIMKLNTNGSLVWQKLMGGSKEDYGIAMALTADGGYVIAAETGSSDGDVSNAHGSSDVWIVKLNAGNGISWQKTIGGSESETAASVLPTTDGGYVVVGNSASTDGDMVDNHGAYDIWVVKLNSEQTIVSKRLLGGSKTESAFGMIATSDNGYVVAGYAGSTDGDLQDNHGANDVWLFKIWL
jgi:hypothetical protein